MEWRGAYFLMLAAFATFVFFIIFYIFNIFKNQSNPKVIQNLLLRLLILVFMALIINFIYQKKYENKKLQQKTPVEISS